MIFSNEPVGSFVVPSLPKKFVRCSVRTRVEHIQMLLRRKLTIPSNMQVFLSLNCITHIATSLSPERQIILVVSFVLFEKCEGFLVALFLYRKIT